MNASIVYQVAQALPLEEQAKLYDMLKADLYTKPKTKRNLNSLPEFTDEDALDYLLNKLDIS